MRVPLQQHSTARLDRPGIEKEVQLYQSNVKQMWTDLAKQENSTLGFYRALQYGGFNNASVVNPGHSIPTDDWQTPYYKDITPKKRAILYYAASEVGETDQTGISEKATAAMALAMLETKETFIADVFNNKTSTGAAYVGPDNLPWQSTAHVTDSGTSSNAPSSNVAFSALGLEQAIQELQQQKNHRGQAMPFYGPFILFGPTGLAGVMSRVVNARQQAQTANNDPNWAGPQISKIHTNPRFTSTTAWGLMDTKAECILLVQQRGVRVKSQEVIEKDGMMWSITEIYGQGNVNWRGSWLTTGA